jgi:aspartate aminotransferase
MTLNGVSKAYSMTGWRIGYAGGQKQIIQAMKKVQSQSTSNPTSISQVAAEAALRGDQTCVHTMVKEFRKRHDVVVDLLNKIPGFDCMATDGTFYVLPNVKQAISAMGLKDDLALSEYFIEGGVALVPGSAFGTPGHIRISIATSMEKLESALQRITTMVEDKSKS